MAAEVHGLEGEVVDVAAAGKELKDKGDAGAGKLIQGDGMRGRRVGVTFGVSLLLETAPLARPLADSCWREGGSIAWREGGEGGEGMRGEKGLREMGPETKS